MAGYGKHSHEFSVAMKKVTGKLRDNIQQEFMDELQKFLKDLSTGIIKYSPYNPPSEYANNNFIVNTVIYGTRGKVFSVPEVDSDADKRRFSGSGKPNEILGLSVVLNQCNAWKTIPKHITIENSTTSESGYPYFIRVEDVGWKHVRAYSPFRRALNAAVNAHSTTFSITGDFRSFTKT